MDYAGAPCVPPPLDRESFHLGVARAACIAGKIDVYEFEEAIEHVLRGGHLTQDARVPVQVNLEQQTTALDLATRAEAREDCPVGG